MDEEILAKICEIETTREPAVLATIVATKGSVPRKAGSKMLIFADGRTMGTIGGGCGEGEVKRQALMVLDAGKPCLYRVEMLNDVAAEEGMVCGGIMDVWIQLV